MKIALVKGDGVFAQLNLTTGPIIVGRSDDADVQISDSSVSSEHARIFLQHTAVLVEDLESTNGTHVNDQLIIAPTLLHDGDKLEFGAVALCFKILDEEAEPQQSAPAVESDAQILGGGLVGIAKAAASEAGRGAKIAALKAQIEKIRRVDLSKALTELGVKAYELRYEPAEYESLHVEIDAIKKAIIDKRAAIAVSEVATFTDKAKAKATELKNKAEAEPLAHSLKGKYEEIGSRIHKSGRNPVLLEGPLKQVTELKAVIARLTEEMNQLLGDSSGREELAASAKKVGMVVSSTPGIHLLRNFKAIAAILLLGVIGIAYWYLPGKDSPTSKEFNGTPRNLSSDQIVFWNEGYTAGLMFSPNTVDGRPADYDDFVVYAKRMGIDLNSSKSDERDNLAIYKAGFMAGLNHGRSAQVSASAGAQASGWQLLPDAPSVRSSAGYSSQARNPTLDYLERNASRNASYSTPPTSRGAGSMQMQEAIRAEIRALTAEVEMLSRTSTLGMPSEMANAHAQQLLAKRQLLQYKQNELMRLRNQ